ncbi:MAG: four helix bundle protein [Terriglobia bacterium]|jgi:four helix bundle protein
MEESPIHSYRDLRVWQKAMDLAEVCYTVTRQFPKEELYGLISQVRRAVVSVPANIAEGHGRNNRGDYVQFLRIAQGSLKELETHLLLSRRLKIGKPGEVDPILDQCDTLGRMLRALIRSLQAGSKKETHPER